MSSHIRTSMATNPTTRHPAGLFGLLLTLHLLGVVSNLSAQNYENIRFERFTIEQGLSSDRVLDLTQDHLGYIWIGTESGVSRYDGYEFKVFRNLPGQLTTLSDNYVKVVHADSYGEIWVGTTTGLNLYNPVDDTFERIYHNPTDPSTLHGNWINDIFETRNGDLWVATSEGLSLYDRVNHAFINHWDNSGYPISFKGINVNAITEDATGTMWFGTAGKGLISFNVQQNQVRYFQNDPIPGVSFPSSTVTDVLVDAFGDLWLGFLTMESPTSIARNASVTNGIGRLNLDTYTFTMFNHHPETQPGIWDRISDIHETSDGTLWVTSYFKNDLSGLHRFDRQTEKFTRYPHDPFNASSLTWSFATALYSDRFNNLWVGTSRGLNKADLGKWQMGLFQFKPDFPSFLLDLVYGIEEVADGVFWFGLDGPGIIEWDRNTSESFNFDPIDPFTPVGEFEIYRSAIPVIKKDKSGEIWLGDGGYGLRRINLATRRNIQYLASETTPGSISGNYITGIHVDEKNTVWLTTSDGLSRYNRPDGTFTTWTVENSAISSNSLNSIFQDSQGIIWLGTKEHIIDPKPTSSEGLIAFDPVHETFQTYRYDPSSTTTISSNAIYGITEDADGNLWIGTSNGLNRYNRDDQTFEHFNVKDGLPNPTVIGLIFDDEGFLWLSTLNGLSRFNSKTRVFSNFDKSYGVQGNRYNDYSYLKTSDGELFFGGVAGANYFHPSDVFESTIKPLVHLTKLLVNNSPLAFEKPIHDVQAITLDWNQNSVGFEFTAINFRAPERTVYEYMLEGYDNAWISSEARRYANYTNLPYGDYTFHVRAINADGIISSDNPAMNIRIQAPFWLTWWAYGFYLIMLAVGVVVVDRYQRKRILQKEREEAREKELAQAKEIEKAYRNLEVAHKNLEAAQHQLVQQEKLASLGQLTAGIAHEIKNPLNFVNNFSDVSLEMIDEALEELGKSTQDVHKAETVTILMDIKTNLAKIHEHGSRADGIVQSMLMHSRGGSGKMEPTDLNAVVKEYVNLAFHGMRAGKDPINVDIDLQLSEKVGDVPLIAEDFSRVILNLTNNAFDAMQDKLTGSGGTKTAYVPKLSVRTKSENGQITIEIEDNGPGIPDDIKDKILQPFFTTKKGTQGTGLGLSITHDIIKAHGGSLGINSHPGQTTFTIHLEKKI
jgi:signal transduction histidine kinase/ligand-binding sensor domain-containing protein